MNTVYPTSRGGAQGFTLTEVSIAMALIGVGILSLLHAMGAGTNVNAAGRELTQAAFLAQEIREWTVQLPFRDPDPDDAGNPPGPDGTSPQTFVDDLDDLMGVTYSPPRDATGTAITGMTDWSQTITLEWRTPENLLTTVTAGSSDVICVFVTIRHRGRDVHTSSWLVFDREAP
ncbi:MAG: type IV pilus modification PilV family protein [Planctomycetota bacterium]